MISIKSIFWTTIFWVFVFFWFFSFLRFRVNPTLTDKIFGIEVSTWVDNINELTKKIDTLSLSISNMEQIVDDNKSSLAQITKYIEEEKAKTKEVNTTINKEDNETNDNTNKKSDKVEVQSWNQVETWIKSE